MPKGTYAPSRGWLSNASPWVMRLRSREGPLNAAPVCRSPLLSHCLPVPYPAKDLVDPCCSALGGLVGGSGSHEMLSALLAGLRQAYEERLGATGEVDERSMLEEGERAAQVIGDPRALTPVVHKLPVHAPSSAAAATRGAVPSGLSAPSPIRPPAPATGYLSPMGLGRAAQGAPPTPVTAALQGIAWVRSMTVGLPNPIDQVPAWLSTLPAAEAAALRDRIVQVRISTGGLAAYLDLTRPEHCPLLLQMAGLVFPAPAGAGDRSAGFQSTHPELAEQRRQDASKLSLLVLERMTEGSADSLAKYAAGSERSLRSLVALSCEVVAWSYQLVSLQFPAVVLRLGLTPFDLFRFIRPFSQYAQ